MSEPTDRLGASKTTGPSSYRVCRCRGVTVPGSWNAVDEVVTPRGLGPCSRIVKRRTRLASAVN